MCKKIIYSIVISLIIFVIMNTDVKATENVDSAYFSDSDLNNGIAFNDDNLLSNDWSWPTPFRKVTANWPRYSDGKYHSGIDLGVPQNSPVYSICDGVVDTVRYLANSYGRHIIIRAVVNGETVYMYYCHMNRLDVKEGQIVKAGQQIGLSGQTGNATGPHLHYEVRNANKHYGNISNPTLNPKNYLPGTGYAFGVH